MWEGLWVAQRRSVARALRPLVVVHSTGMGTTPRTPEEVAATVGVEFTDDDPRQAAWVALFEDMQRQWLAGELPDYESVEAAFSDAADAADAVEFEKNFYPHTRRLAGPLAAQVQAGVAEALV